MQNLIQILRELRSPDRPSPYTRERIRDMLRTEIKTRLSRFEYRTYDRLDYFDDYLPSSNSRQVVRQILKRFGSQLMPLAIVEQSSDDVLDFLNNTMHSAVRDRFDFAEHLTSCLRGEYYSCNDCGEIEERDTMSCAYDDYLICESCCNNHYRWSDNRDTYISEDDYYNERDEDEDEGIIRAYHSSKRVLGHIPSSFDNRKTRVYLGLELEMEVSEDFSRSDLAEHINEQIGTYDNKYQYCAFEEDGSLGHGFEMVTGYTGLDVHKTQLSIFKNRMNGLKSHDTKTCGLHVHICKNDMSLLHASKMILFIHDSNNQRMIRALARRDSSRFAQIQNKKASYDWLKSARVSSDPLSNLNKDRYEALNFHNPNTVEFRLFRGTLKFETIMACLEFTYATWFFTRDASVSDLTTRQFIEFICRAENKRDTVFLRQYLREKGFEIPKTALVKNNPRLQDAIKDFAEV